MAVRKHNSHGKWVWQARVAYQGHRRSVYCATKNEAKDQESKLLQELKGRQRRILVLAVRAMGSCRNDATA